MCVRARGIKKHNTHKIIIRQKCSVLFLCAVVCCIFPIIYDLMCVLFSYFLPLFCILTSYLSRSATTRAATAAVATLYGITYTAWTYTHRERKRRSQNETHTKQTHTNTIKILNVELSFFLANTNRLLIHMLDLTQIQMHTPTIIIIIWHFKTDVSTLYFCILM